MNIKHDNFIGIYENAYSPEYCQSVVNYFEQMAAAGFAVDRHVDEKRLRVDKDDSMIFCQEPSILPLGVSSALFKEFNDVFWNECYQDYADKFSILRNAESHNSYYMKIQKTQIGGGYHIWHFESDDRKASNRILAWMLYLNDVEEGGETEFLYLHKRIKTKAGTLLLWPAGFTHTHRGNPPLSNSKYVITGWVEF
jgi:hypothetical protein